MALTTTHRFCWWDSEGNRTGSEGSYWEVSFEGDRKIVHESPEYQVIFDFPDLWLAVWSGGDDRYRYLLEWKV